MTIFAIIRHLDGQTTRVYVAREEEARRLAAASSLYQGGIVELHAVDLPEITPEVLCALLHDAWAGAKWRELGRFRGGRPEGEKTQGELFA